MFLHPEAQRAPLTISNCGNNFGPRQHPEKLIPKTILNAINGKKIPVYGKGVQIRDWVFVEDHCDALDVILKKGVFGETYLVGANNEHRNIDVVIQILDLLGKKHDLIEYVTDRPGHDVRYALDSSKTQESLGWRVKYKFTDALSKTIEHYTNNANLYQLPSS